MSGIAPQGKCFGRVTAVDVVPAVFGGESHSQGWAVCQECSTEAPWRKYSDGLYLFCRCGDDPDGKDTAGAGTNMDSFGISGKTPCG